MNKFLFAAALIVSGLLVGCNQLTQYTITEQEINQSLAKHNNFSKDIGLPGVADAHIVLTNLTSQIGREEPNKVTLTGDANLDMNSLFGSQKATMKLKLKALPVFDKEKGAIFLKEMEVVDATVQPEKMQTVMQTLLPYLNQALRNYFNQQPAYVLREDGSQGEAMLILCVRQKHPFSRSIEINDCTIPGIKDPPPRRLAPSPPRWRHVKNCRAVYQRNLWTGYRNAQSGSARDHR